MTLLFVYINLEKRGGRSCLCYNCGCREKLKWCVDEPTGAQLQDSESRPAGFEGSIRPDTPSNHWPAGTTQDDRRCWICESQTRYMHCKIMCTRCGFTRDCSDP